MHPGGESFFPNQHIHCGILDSSDWVFITTSSVIINTHMGSAHVCLQCVTWSGESSWRSFESDVFNTVYSPTSLIFANVPIVIQRPTFSILLPFIRILHTLELTVVNWCWSMDFAHNSSTNRHNLLMLGWTSQSGNDLYSVLAYTDSSG
jgi:hypothetical protein